MAFVALALLAALLFLWAAVLYNKLTRLRNLKEEGWSGIDVQLKRRFDLVPNIVATVKGYAAHEKDTLSRVAEARAAVAAAASVAERIRAEESLSSGLAGLLAVVERYPDLKANVGFLELQRELSRLEDDLQLARRYYNGTVREYNTTIKSFPAMLISHRLGHSEAPFFQAGDDSRATPEVAL